jgi:hypothetical protein
MGGREATETSLPRTARSLPQEEAMTGVAAPARVYRLALTMGAA